MSTQPFLLSFARCLNERLQRGVITSEADVRFTFFHTLTNAGLHQHWELHSEVPLPTYPGKRMDALISGDRGHQMAVEFKYHREKLSTLPKPQLAGGMFADLFRLGTAHHALRCDCYFVYLTDTTMVAYLKQHRHGCVDVFSLPEGLKLRLGVGVLEGKTKTFHRALRSAPSPVEVEVVLRADLHGGLHLLVYQVAHVPDPIYDHG